MPIFVEYAKARNPRIRVVELSEVFITTTPAAKTIRRKFRQFRHNPLCVFDKRFWSRVFIR
jgi:hypothetical protein